jgi:hypothetical protein
MVSGDPEGSQGERRRAQEIVQREQSTSETWVLFGYRHVRRQLTNRFGERPC